MKHDYWDTETLVDSYPRGINGAEVRIYSVTKGAFYGIEVRVAWRDRAGEGFKPEACGLTLTIKEWGQLYRHLKELA